MYRHLPALLTTLAAITLLSACESSQNPLAPGAVAKDHGVVGATEGPAYHDGYLYFTDGGPLNRMNWATGKAEHFRTHCGAPNGLMFDPQGRLIVCESEGRRMVRYEKDGHLTVLADRYHGMRFNSPNDVTMDSQGRIYFTDPRYGPRDTMQLRDQTGHLVEGVYRIDAPGQVTRILSYESVQRPNGILITPCDQYLYICDNNNNSNGGARQLVRFDLNKDGSVRPGSKKLIYDWKDGRGPDGMKMDHTGRLYVMAGTNENTDWEVNTYKAGCYILSPGGKLITFIPTGPDEACNVNFGGEDQKTLCMTSGKHLWTIPLKEPGWTSGRP
jgi:gluconolactonase